MDRRKFLLGSAAIGAASVATGAGATLPKIEYPDNFKDLFSQESSGESNWRLKYRASKEEIIAGTVIFDQTYPPGDQRRYEPPKKQAIEVQYGGQFQSFFDAS